MRLLFLSVCLSVCNTFCEFVSIFLSISFFFRFQASGDHLPVPPPAPAHAQLAAVQAAQYNTKNYDLGNTGAEGFDDGQYDPRYNDPNFEGNLGGRAAPYVQQPQQQYVAQPQPQPQPQQPQPQAYNNLNNINYIAQYQSTTPHPHRFQPPGKPITWKSLKIPPKQFSNIRALIRMTFEC